MNIEAKRRLCHGIIIAFILAHLCGKCIGQLRLVAVRDVSKRRAGEPTRTNSCQNIREVPSSLRKKGSLKPEPLDPFYQKYTEAYGLPIASSKYVADDALRRFCYEVRFLLAGNSRIRRAVYKSFGHFAVLGVNETSYELPQFRDLDKKRFETNRGLGAKVSRPVSMAGEDNALCDRKDLRLKEDIVLHEISHAVDIIGAEIALPGWFKRMNTAYKRAMKKKLWENVYNSANVYEYFANAAQMFFNVKRFSAEVNGVFGPITHKDQLRTYDPDLFELVWQAFPCDNPYIERCQGTREEEDAQKLMMDCDIGGHKHSYCHSLKEAGRCFSDPDYMEENCPNVCSNENLLDKHKSCEYWASVGDCEKREKYMMKKCKASCDKFRNKETANKHSSCETWAKQGLCQGTYSDYMTTNCAESCASLYSRDRNLQCSVWASRGDCVSNPEMMFFMCPKSCERELKTIYVDNHPLCKEWAENRECVANSKYMVSSCEMSCYDRMSSKDLWDKSQTCKQTNDLISACKNNGKEMSKSCEKSCSEVLISPLVNKAKDCQERADNGQCSQFDTIVDCPTFCYNVTMPVLKDSLGNCAKLSCLSDTYTTVYCPKTCKKSQLN